VDSGWFRGAHPAIIVGSGNSRSGLVGLGLEAMVNGLRQ